MKPYLCPTTRIVLGPILLLCLLSSSSRARVSADSTNKLVHIEPIPITRLDTLVEYPAEAKQNGIEGKVMLSLLIDTSGSVRKVIIDRSSNPIFNESAKAAAMKMKFHPAMQNGRPVKVFWSIPIMYRLSSGHQKREQ